MALLFWLYTIFVRLCFSLVFSISSKSASKVLSDLWNLCFWFLFQSGNDQTSQNWQILLESADFTWYCKSVVTVYPFRVIPVDAFFKFIIENSSRERRKKRFQAWHSWEEWTRRKQRPEGREILSSFDYDHKLGNSRFSISKSSLKGWRLDYGWNLSVYAEYGLDERIFRPTELRDDSYESGHQTLRRWIDYSSQDYPPLCLVGYAGSFHGYLKPLAIGMTRKLNILIFLIYANLFVFKPQSFAVSYKVTGSCSDRAWIIL